MMPLLDKLLSSRKSAKNDSDCRLLVNIGVGANNDRYGLYFGADQVRILLFRECEWRGRKLLFDSVTARKVSASPDSPQSALKQNNATFTRNGAGLIPEHEKVACDDVNLLSEMVFGTVAMTYRGPLFKVHALSAPKCIMCTKVFPASDHAGHRLSNRLSDETLGHSLNLDSNSSVGSVHNTINSASHTSCGTFSGNSLSPELRKNSTCSSTSSGRDLEIPLFSSSQSLESNGSSGFGSFTSLRRRWLRAVSTTLSHSELDEVFGIQAYAENSGLDGNNHRRHKTRLGLAVLIQLTPGHERQMEVRLLEHAAQLEGMLNRLCYSCIDSCRSHGKSNGECKGLSSRMHRASSKCITWLLRLLADGTSMPSLWHEVIMNSTTPVVRRTHVLHRNLQQMCQLLNGVDTKSTNFFLSTIVTAVLTHHLGWVQTVMPTHEKKMVENLGRRYPCNALWAQLGDLYGALGNPTKLVHTVITGDAEKSPLINAVLTFLSYFIRSAIVQKRREYRCPSQQDVKEAIAILERMKKKNSFIFKPVKARDNATVSCEGSSGSSYEKPTSKIRRVPSETKTTVPTTCAVSSMFNDCESGPVDSKIPRLKRTSSSRENLDKQPPNLFDSRFKSPVKLEACDDEEVSTPSLTSNLLKKECPTSTVKIIVSETTTPEIDLSGTKQRLPRRTHPYDWDEKIHLRDPESRDLTMDAKLTSLRSRTDSGFDSQKFDPAGFAETEMYFSRLDVPKARQQSQVFFTLGEEDKVTEQQPETQVDCNCQCSFAFTRVPSTSAELPEGVLRKIIQRNFPESSKSINGPTGSSFLNDRTTGACPKCNGAGYSVPQTFDGSKLLLETPTNATEVLRTCANSVGHRSTKLLRSNSLEALMEANGVVELPMPRSKKPIPTAATTNEVSGFTRTLLQRRVTNNGDKSVDSTVHDSGYTSGLVIQGLTKKKKRRKAKDTESNDGSEDTKIEADWLSQLREEVNINARFPIIDQPVSEALCILADLDNWQVGILSNTSPAQNPLLPVGMSRLVGTMLDSFAYLWTKYRSPTHCIGIFECKLREMWLRSEALAEMLMSVDVCDVSIASLTKALDLDAADIPLLLAVATTHSPQIAHRFGLSLA